MEDEAELVELMDGARLLVRPVHRDDAPLLAEGFAHLSQESRRLRFLSAKPRLSQAELDYFTQIDHHDHEALGAMTPEGEPVGVARFIRDPESPDRAEFAVVVVDAWQDRGVGTMLLDRLMVRAREEGVEHFTALVAVDNDSMMRVLHDIGGELRVVERTASAVSYELTLPPAGDQPRDLLRAVGRRELRVPHPIRDRLRRLPPHMAAD